MEFSVQTGQQNIAWADLVDTWQRLEAWGFDGAWCHDHFIPAGTRDVDGPCMDGWTALAALAALIPRMRLGVFVTGNTYRNPALLAKIATTIDHISGGRLNMGMGASWYELEHTAYGFELGTPGQRLDRLEEALEVITRLWSGADRVSFEGNHYSLHDAPFLPLPLQSPRPPIWIGGGGERRTLRLVARYADAWNGLGPLDTLRRKAEVLHQHCLEVGRDPAAIQLTAGAPVIPDAIYEGYVARTAERLDVAPDEVRRRTFGGNAEDMRAATQAYLDAGFTHIVLMVNTPYDFPVFERIATEVLPAFR
ncbi:MAG: TIGR03560 family F420-dependent LLM class oxidoreductase [Dehalococcoidia bacterium]|nr:TIGR03560 family F420-dependent LLM class oxidoreductase [Dehalococcoidia bacterium]